MQVGQGYKRGNGDDPVAYTNHTHMNMNMNAHEERTQTRRRVASRNSEQAAGGRDENFL